MRRTTALAYLCCPAIVTLGTFAAALRFKPFELRMFAAYVLAGGMFYAAPYVLWTVVASLARFSNAVWHAGFIASSISLLAIASFWLSPADPSGLPFQWMLYWPLAILLQIVVGGLAAWVRRARAPRRPHNPGEPQSGQVGNS